MVRPEKKGVGLVNDVVPNLDKHNQLISEVFARTHSPTDMCQLLGKHSPLVSRDKDVYYMQKSIPSLWRFMVLKC